MLSGILHFTTRPSSPITPSRGPKGFTPYPWTVTPSRPRLSIKTAVGLRDATPHESRMQQTAERPKFRIAVAAPEEFLVLNPPRSWGERNIHSARNARLRRLTATLRACTTWLPACR